MLLPLEKKPLGYLSCYGATVILASTTWEHKCDVYLGLDEVVWS